MAAPLYWGLGSMHRTHEDARTAKNPLTEIEVGEIIAAFEAEQDRIQEARMSLACPACGRTGERKLPTRGANGQPDVLLCATVACYRQWQQKRTYLNSR
jgi:hypothetical protein